MGTLHSLIATAALLFGVCSGLAIATPPPGINTSQEAVLGPETYEGAGFTLSVENDFQVTESGNGQIYFLELRRKGADEKIAAIKMMLVPGGAKQFTPADFANMVESDVMGVATSEGLAVEDSGAVERQIAGEQRPGSSFRLGDETQSNDLELYCFSSGDDVIAILTKVDLEDRERMRAAIEQALSSLQIRVLTTQSSRPVGLGSFELRVPVLTPQELGEIENGVVLKLRLAQGIMEIGTTQFWTSDDAIIFYAGFLEARSKEIGEAALALGGQLLRTRSSSVWIQKGLLQGIHSDIQAVDGSMQSVSVYGLLAGSDFLYVNFEAPIAATASLTRQMRSMLNTLRLPGDPIALFDALGDICLNQDQGLTLYYPDKMGLSERDHQVPRYSPWDTSEAGEDAVARTPRYTLTSRGTTGVDDFRIIFDVLPSKLEQGELSRRAIELVEQLFDGPSLGQSAPFEFALLGTPRGGVAIPFESGETAYQAYALPAPHRNGTVIAYTILPTAAADECLWVFANILNGFTAHPDGTRSISGPGITMFFDPAAWTMNSTPNLAGNNFVFRQRSGGSGFVSVAIEKRASLVESNATMVDLVERAKTAARLRQRSIGAELTGDHLASVKLESQKSTVASIGVSTAVRNEMRATVKDGQSYFCVTQVVRTGDALVTIEGRAKSGDAPALAAMEALMAAVVVEDKLQYAGEIVLIGNLKLELPIGYHGLMHTVSSFDQVEVTSGLYPDRRLNITSVPAAFLGDETAIWDQVEETVIANAKEWEWDFRFEPISFDFLGEPATGRLVVYSDAEGEATHREIKLFPVRGVLGYEITMSITEDQHRLRAAEDYGDILASIEAVPSWRHESSAGFGIDYPEDNMLVLRTTRESDGKDGYVLIVNEGTADFYVDDLGDWTTSQEVLSPRLKQVQAGLTAAQDIGAQGPVEVNMGFFKLRSQVSLHVEKELQSKMTLLRNSEPLQTFTVAIEGAALPTDFNAAEQLMVDNLLENPNFNVVELKVIRRTILGQDVRGLRMGYESSEGDLRYQERYILGLADAVLDLAFYYKLEEGALARTQLDLFLDNLELVE